jgi:ABC-type Fe3+-hydroxamate transport system substrate-binding protein
MILDDLGHAVARQGKPRRVVSLVPSLSETFAGYLVGATDYCTHPSTLDVPRVGGSKYPRVADVVALDPDLVIANVEENRREDVESLRANGIPVWVTAAPATVPDALASIRRLARDMFEWEPEWLAAAERDWRTVPPQWARAIVPVWRKPWVVLGRDTFAGDLLQRLGVANVFARDPERYPRPKRFPAAELVVLPDEPYEFTADDGPQFFDGIPCALVTGRYLTWYGPSLADARAVLERQLRSTL